MSFAIAARILTKSAFGELGMIQSTVGMFGVFTGIGLGVTATKHVAGYRAAEPIRAGGVIGLCLAMSLLIGGLGAATLAIASPHLAAHALNAPHLAVELRIGCVLLLLNTIDGVQIGALAGFEAFAVMARTNVFKGLAILTLVTSGAYYSGVRGAVAGLAVAAAVGLVANHYALRSEAGRQGIIVGRQESIRELRTLWCYSTPAFLSGALVVPAGWLARALLVNQQGGYGEVALYTVFSRLQDAVILGGQSVGAALLPMLASESGSKSKRLNRGNMLVSWVIGTVVILPLLAYPEGVGFLFGSQYATTEAIQTAVLVLISTAIMMYKQGLSRVLMAADGLMWWGVLSNAVWALILIAATVALVNNGAKGLAAAWLLANALSTLLFMPFYLRIRLAPRGLLASRAATVVWAALLGPAVLAYFGASLSSRLVASAVALAVSSVCFVRLFDARGPCAEERGIC